MFHLYLLATCNLSFQYALVLLRLVHVFYEAIVPDMWSENHLTTWVKLTTTYKQASQAADTPKRKSWSSLSNFLPLLDLLGLRALR